MVLPFFYTDDLSETSQTLQLGEETSRHMVQVLRMQAGDRLHLTNGLGLQALAEVSEAHKKSCGVTILSSATMQPVGRRVAVAISPVKNTSRFEWFLEKATELGVSDIFPLVCKRTEREHFRHGRMNAICISAMLQSQQVWLPVLHQPIAFDQLVGGQPKAGVKKESTLNIPAYQHKWVAHCAEGDKKQLGQSINPSLADSIILIGPEGDFTKEEIAAALSAGYQPVALGDTRLRTETAGVAAATLLRLSGI